MVLDLKNLLETIKNKQNFLTLALLSILIFLFFLIFFGTLAYFFISLFFSSHSSSPSSSLQEPLKLEDIYQLNSTLIEQACEKIPLIVQSQTNFSDQQNTYFLNYSLEIKKVENDCIGSISILELKKFEKDSSNFLVLPLKGKAVSCKINKSTLTQLKENNLEIFSSCSLKSNSLTCLINNQELELCSNFSGMLFDPTFSKFFSFLTSS
ncbi:MAG: hypothetical protein N3D10_01685 [Candidatus Micrarchaeota archaeon]|nr:hypothetical protein [Candidatus Micrarchaeota archaeon]